MRGIAELPIDTGDRQEILALEQNGKLSFNPRKNESVTAPGIESVSRPKISSESLPLGFLDLLHVLSHNDLFTRVCAKGRNIDMKRNVGAMLGLGLGILLMLSTVQAGDNDNKTGEFSNASLHGKYVVSFHGWVSGGGSAVTGQSLGPQNGVGLLIADGQGNFTGTQTANILYNSNGVPTSSSACGGSFTSGSTAICTDDLTGTYTVKSDGTGTTTATATPVAGSDCRCGPSTGFTTTASFVMASHEDLSIVGTDFDVTVAGHAHLQGKGD
jgi:hypothetical protein